jgi:hypothetical protein
MREKGKKSEKNVKKTEEENERRKATGRKYRRMGNKM